MATDSATVDASSYKTVRAPALAGLSENHDNDDAGGREVIVSGDMLQSNGSLARANLPLCTSNRLQPEPAGPPVREVLDDPVYAFNGGGNSRLVPDQTSNACTRRDGEDELLV
jgi:hypothetical protein